MPETMPNPKDDGAVERASSELEALANLIERPPLDDVQLEQSVALRSARAIRTVLAALRTPDAADVERCERDLIVAWLRDPNRRSIPTMDVVWSAAYNACLTYVSAAIERGEHLPLRGAALRSARETQPTPAGEPSREARELLALGFDRHMRANIVDHWADPRCTVLVEPALRAIDRALVRPVPCGDVVERKTVVNLARLEADAARYCQQHATRDTDKLYRMGQKDALLMFSDMIERLPANPALPDTPTLQGENNTGSEQEEVGSG